MTIRTATVNDIKALHEVRMAVKENVLSNPALVTVADYTAYLTTEGKGWLSEVEGCVAGFAIIRHRDNNIWALFVHPDFESKGIGKALQRTMIDWHFQHYDSVVWLSTGPGTRAEEFYRRTGWKEVGKTTDGETRFEMTKVDWQTLHEV